MKVIFKDLRHGEVKIVPENLDDLWHLYHIIEEGDLVRAVTFRTVADQKDDKIRAKKMEKKRMKLGIRVEKLEFHEFSNRLRVQGVIVEGEQDLGSHHTFNIDAEEMETFSIVKHQWKSYQLDRIEEAVRQRSQPLLVFVSLDEEKASVALLRQSGIQHLADIESHRSGKMYESKETTSEYYGDVLAVVKTCKTSESPLIVIGPGFTREHFINFGKEKDPEMFRACITHATGHAGMNGVHEAVKNGIVDQISKDNRVSLETQWVEKLFEEIKKDALAAYGMKEVEGALLKGAVTKLLIADTVIRSKNGDYLLDLARKTHSDFLIINSMHDAGKKFEGIGGVGAILRFKL